VTGGSDPDQFWWALVVRLLHPVQIQIIEAMLWIDQPLSASALVKIFDGKIRPSTVAYHVLHLSELRALRKVGKRTPKRGSQEKLYRVRFP
jgi:hypothetical protein